MKIFGIGLSKTGTSSLNEGLRMLGFNVEHYPTDLGRLDELDGATDIPVAAAYRELDRKYPRSKFILTERELEPWLASCADWFPRAQGMSESGKRLQTRLYGTAVYDREQFAAAFHRHREEVLAYFAERPDDLLVMDICGGDGWEKLCPFLERPVPDEPFPWENSRKVDLERAFELHRYGRLEIAKAAYERVLEAEPEHAEALHHLGLIHHQEGDAGEAERLIRKAIGLVPEEIRFRFNLATVLRSRGRQDEADRALRDAAKVQGGTAASFVATAAALAEKKDVQQAMHMLRMALALEPHHGEAALRLGQLLLRAGRPGEAIEALDKVEAVAPQHLAAQGKKAEALTTMKRFPEAFEITAALISGHPNTFETHHAAANALQGAGRHAEAMPHYRQALSLRPEDGHAHFNMANSLGVLKQYERAIQHYQRALELQPGWAVWHNNFADALINLGRFPEAIEQCQTAIRLRPGLAEAHANLGFAYQHEDRLDEALQCNRTAVELKPDVPQFHTNLAASLQRRFRVAEAIASLREALRLDPGYAAAHSTLLYLLTYQDPESLKVLYEEHRQFGREQEKRHTAVCHDRRRWKTERPLRVGFLSPDLRAHPVATFVAALFKHHNPERISVTCYSDVRTPDGFTQRFQGQVGQWRNIFGVPDEEVSRGIQEDGIQVLVDLTGHMADNRLPLYARKPAPAQVGYMGYMNTTGLRTMDYWLTDREVNPPETQPYFTERFWYLPGCYVCYAPPQVEVAVTPPPMLRNGYPTFGVFNNAAKISPRAVGVWADLLRAVPGAKLMIRAMQLTDATNRETVRAWFAERGIGPERLVLRGNSGKVEYLRDFGLIDVALDTFPNNGNTTTHDTLWMGVPVVALKGDACVGRMGLSILNHAGHPEWVADSHEHYIQVAADLVENPERLKEIRRALRPEYLASSICDGEGFARAMEEALQGMWQAWRTGGEAQAEP